MDPLLKQAIDGARAFEDLARLHRPALVQLATRLLGNEADAEDAVQEALIDALLGLARWEQRGSFKTWLCGYVKQECRRIRRERDAVPTVALDAAIDIAGADPLDAIIAEETANEARAAIAKLPKAQREAFEMYADGKSAKEIARVMGITEGAAHQKVIRAQKKLRTEMGTFCG